MPFSRRETILWLMVCLESRAPLNARKLFWYHARVVVAFFGEPEDKRFFLLLLCCKSLNLKGR